MKRRSQKTVYIRQLDETLDRVFAAFDDREMRWGELVRASGLCYATVRRANRRLSHLPRYDTVLRLARAVGLDLAAVGAAGPKMRKAV